MYNVASAVTKKKVHPEFRAMLLNLRSLTIEKLNDDGQPEGERPLGLGECELRFFCKVAVQQIKEKTQAHFTNAPAVDTARHAATVANAESAARLV